MQSRARELKFKKQKKEIKRTNLWEKHNQASIIMNHVDDNVQR